MSTTETTGKKRRKSSVSASDAQDEFLANLQKIVPKDDSTSDMGGLEITRSRDMIPSQVKYLLTTGIRPFDDLVGGFPFGRVCEVFGTENCGKTGLMLRCALRATKFHIVELTKQDDGTTLRQSIDPEASEVHVLYIDNEQSFDDDNKIVIDGQRLDVMVARSDTVDMMFKIIERAIDGACKRQENYDEKGVNKKVFLVVIVDTIASTTSREELEQEWGKDDYPRQAGQISKGFRKIIRDVNRHNVVLICTNQVRENIKAQSEDKRRFGPTPVDVEYTTFGGRALRFYASQRIFMENLFKSYRLGDSQFENGYVIGFSAVKNRIKPPLRHGRMVLLLDVERGGLNNIYSILETLIYLKYAEQEKSVVRFRFGWAGVTTTTFEGAATTLADDDEEDPRESLRTRKARRDPFIEHRAFWPEFYVAHKRDFDALWNAAVQTAFATQGDTGNSRAVLDAAESSSATLDINPLNLMSSTIDIVIDERLTELVAKVVRKHFPDVHQYVPAIRGMVRTKTNKDGDIVSGMTMPVVLKKTPPVYTACDVPPYLLIIDGAFWNEAADSDIRGMIGNAILGIEVQVAQDEEGKDVVRFKSRKPDLVIFTEAVRMFGAFTPGVLKIREIAQGVATAALGFVRDEPEEEVAAEAPPAEEAPAEEASAEDENAEKPRARRKRTSKVVKAHFAADEKDWPDPPRVRTGEEIENEEALLAARPSD